MSRKPTALESLQAAIASRNTLAWVLVHAPTGDTDKAVAQAWRNETRPDTLARFAREVLKIPHRPLTRTCWRCVTGEHYLREFVLKGGRKTCRGCCRRYRAKIATPTWEECLEGRESSEG